MIKKLRVKNYKSLRDLDLELTRTNVLVGPNMSGKSNLIDCLKFLTHLCSPGLGLNRALSDRGGMSEVAWKGGHGNLGEMLARWPFPEVTFQLIIEILGNEYEYEISVTGGVLEPISIVREHLTVMAESKVSPLIDLKQGQGAVTHRDGSSAFTASPEPGRSALEYPVPGWEGVEFRNEVSSWRFYRLNPIAMKQLNVAAAQPFLQEYGENFSSWLMTLANSHPDEFRLIKQVARDTLPDLEDVLTPLTQFATTYVTTREKYLTQPIALSHMSDGEIVFLALLSLIFAPPALAAPLYCIEEPENHLHPRLLETLVEVLRQRQNELGPQAAQIVLTTHSLSLVDKMSIDDLVVVERAQGATRCTRPGCKKHLRDRLQREELGLGDLLYSGVLGE